MANNEFDEKDKQAIYRAIHQRRDMRHFLSHPIDPKVLEAIFDAAHAAPSVGFMQPWRFIRITNSDLRKTIHTHVDEERKKTAEALGERKEEFMRLKVEGILDCSELIVVSLMPKREEYIFGRRTMPHMDLASAACAIQNMWLAARAEGIGLGWVSLFDPAYLASLLNMPEGCDPIAIICLGEVEQFYEKPMLELENWREREDVSEWIFENQWRD